MVSRQYIVWCVMLALLIATAGLLLASGVFLALYVIGMTVVGPKVSAVILLIAAVLFLFPYRWFIEAA